MSPGKISHLGFTQGSSKAFPYSISGFFNLPQDTQNLTPSHEVTERGTRVPLKCDSTSGHLFLHWYRQILEQTLEFLVLFYKSTLLEKSETFKHRFSARRTDGSFSTLQIQPTELGDSATYLCASSTDTALQRPLQPVHKSSCFCLFSSSQHPFPVGLAYSAVSKYTNI